MEKRPVIAFKNLVPQTNLVVFCSQHQKCSVVEEDKWINQKQHLEKKPIWNIHRQNHKLAGVLQSHQKLNRNHQNH